MERIVQRSHDGHWRRTQSPERYVSDAADRNLTQANVLRDPEYLRMQRKFSDAFERRKSLILSDQRYHREGIVTARSRSTPDIEATDLIAETSSSNALPVLLSDGSSGAAGQDISAAGHGTTIATTRSPHAWAGRTWSVPSTVGGSVWSSLTRNPYQR